MIPTALTAIFFVAQLLPFIWLMLLIARRFSRGIRRSPEDARQVMRSLDRGLGIWLLVWLVYLVLDSLILAVTSRSILAHAILWPARLIVPGFLLRDAKDLTSLTPGQLDTVLLRIVPAALPIILASLASAIILTMVSRSYNRPGKAAPVDEAEAGAPRLLPYWHVPAVPGSLQLSEGFSLARWALCLPVALCALGLWNSVDYLAQLSAYLALPDPGAAPLPLESLTEGIPTILFRGMGVDLSAPSLLWMPVTTLCLVFLVLPQVLPGWGSETRIEGGEEKARTPQPPIWTFLASLKRSLGASFDVLDGEIEGNGPDDEAFVLSQKPDESGSGGADSAGTESSSIDVAAIMGAAASGYRSAIGIQKSFMENLDQPGILLMSPARSGKRTIALAHALVLAGFRRRSVLITVEDKKTADELYSALVRDYGNLVWFKILEIETILDEEALKTADLRWPRIVITRPSYAKPLLEAFEAGHQKSFLKDLALLLCIRPEDYDPYTIAELPLCITEVRDMASRHRRSPGGDLQTVVVSRPYANLERYLESSIQSSSGEPAFIAFESWHKDPAFSDQILCVLRLWSLPRTAASVFSTTIIPELWKCGMGHSLVCGSLPGLEEERFRETRIALERNTGDTTRSAQNPIHFLDRETSIGDFVQSRVVIASAEDRNLARLRYDVAAAGRNLQGPVILILVVSDPWQERFARSLFWFWKPAPDALGGPFPQELFTFKPGEAAPPAPERFSIIKDGRILGEVPASIASLYWHYAFALPDLPCLGFRGTTIKPIAGGEDTAARRLSFRTPDAAACTRSILMRDFSIPTPTTLDTFSAQRNSQTDLVIHTGILTETMDMLVPGIRIRESDSPRWTIREHPLAPMETRTFTSLVLEWEAASCNWGLLAEGLFRRILPLLLDSGLLQFECLYAESGTVRRLYFFELYMEDDRTLDILKVYLLDPRQNGVLQGLIDILQSLAGVEAENEPDYTILPGYLNQDTSKTAPPWDVTELAALRDFLRPWGDTVKTRGKHRWLTPQELEKRAAGEKSPAPPVSGTHRTGFLIAIIEALKAILAQGFTVKKCHICGQYTREIRYSTQGPVCLECLKTKTICAHCAQPIEPGQKHLSLFQRNGGFVDSLDGRIRCHQSCYDAEKIICDYCGFPAIKPKRLSDGLYICATCMRDSLSEAKAAKTILTPLRNHLAETLAMHVATTPDISFMDYAQMSRTQGIPFIPTDKGKDIAFLGFYMPGKHRIAILPNLPAWQFTATAAHEWTHAWQGETGYLAAAQALGNPEALIWIEGMAEWVECSVLIALGFDARAKAIRDAASPSGDEYSAGLYRFLEIEQAVAPATNKAVLGEAMRRMGLTPAP